MPSLFHIDLNLSKEYCLWLDDLFKFTTLLVVVHIFGWIGGKSKGTGEFLQNVLITIIGFTFYHLVVKKIMKIVYKENEEEGFSSTIRLFK
jgi:hypothetical protein